MSELSRETILAIRQAATFIQASQRAIALTGAGISTPSGVPDFRSAGSGLWTRFLPMQVASLSTFRHDPKQFFEWLRPLASHMLGALPNPAHRALAALEQAGYIKTVITQNIDALHQRAGSRRVLEIHGTFNTLSCVGCFNQFPADDLIQPYLEHGEIPYCPQCGAILKPDVILFEEQLPVRTWTEAEKAAKTCDLMLVVGTSLEVMPSAGLPMRALENGARLLIVNHTPTYLDVRADVIIRANVADSMPQLAAEVLHV